MRQDSEWLVRVADLLSPSSSSASSRSAAIKKLCFIFAFLSSCCLPLHDDEMMSAKMNAFFSIFSTWARKQIWFSLPTLDKASDRKKTSPRATREALKFRHHQPLQLLSNRKIIFYERKSAQEEPPEFVSYGMIGTIRIKASSFPTLMRLAIASGRQQQQRQDQQVTSANKTISKCTRVQQQKVY